MAFCGLVLLEGSDLGLLETVLVSVSGLGVGFSLAHDVIAMRKDERERRAAGIGADVGGSNCEDKSHGRGFLHVVTRRHIHPD